MRLRADFQYLFIVLCLSAAAVAEPIPKDPQDVTIPSSLGDDVALSSQTGADGVQPVESDILPAVSGSLPTDPVFPGGESSGQIPKPADGTLVAAGLPVKETDFGPPIPQDPTKDPTDFGAYPGYPQPADVPDLYDPKTRRRNGYMEYYEQTRGECLDGENIYCCRWGQREVLSSQTITYGPIKCVYWPAWIPVWRLPQCIPDQQECCAGVDEFGNGINCKKANKASQKQKQGAGARDDETPNNGGDPPGGSSERQEAPASQGTLIAPGAQRFEDLDLPPPTRIPETSSPWKLELPPWFKKPDWLQIGG